MNDCIIDPGPTDVDGNQCWVRIFKCHVTISCDCHVIFNS